MSKFILFAGDSHYADGGMLDFEGAYSDIETALEAAKKSVTVGNNDWFHIADASTLKIVAAMSGRYCGQVNDDHSEAALYTIKDDLLVRL